MERFYRRRLPHWEMDGAWYYLTFRLYGSIPQAKFEQWHLIADRKRQEIIKRYGRISDRIEHAIKSDLMDKAERFLDSQFLVRYLEQPTAAQSFMDNLARGTEKLYSLGPWVIMPNHVHVLLTAKVVQSGNQVTLARILQHLKGASAIEINRALKCMGTLWQREYFDRIIRSPNDFRRKAIYIEDNPVKAGLCHTPEDWPWSSASKQLKGFELPIE